MSGRFVSILVTATPRDGLDAIQWLRSFGGPLPTVLATFAVSLEFAVGRATVMDTFDEVERRAAEEPEP